MIGGNVFEGKRFEGVDIFDIHAHIDATADFEQLAVSPDSVVKTMDAVGINGACVSSIAAIHADVGLGNADMLEAVKKYPGRLYGYVVVSPHEADTDLDALFACPGIKGLKVHAAFHRASIADDRYAPYFEYADRHGLPVLFHTWEVVDTPNVVKWAKLYPNAKYIIGHSAMRTWEVKREVIEAIRSLDNVYADTTISMTYDGAVEFAASKLGAERLCYGSDLPFYDCRHVVGRVATCRLSDADKLRILGKNARELLGIK